MLSKYSIRALTLLRFPRYEFSQQQQKQREQQDDWDERTIEAEEANPTLENKEKAFSYFRLFSRIFWWTTSALFGYNLYLNNYKTDPTQELGYQKQINDAAKYCQDQYQAFYDFMTKPAIDKLLPDIPELPFGYEIPKTLVLNISGTLLHMDYVFGVGGEIKRRNGLQRFLEKLPKMYEVVILSDDETMFTQQITQKLDPTRQIFAGAFGRESMVFEKGRYIRDLKYINRPLNRVIVLDSDPERMYQYQDNGIFIKPFDGKQNDEVLKDVLLLLEHLSKPQIKDVRAELRKFGNFDPQIKYLDEVKAREINIKQTMNKGFFSIMNQRKNPQFDQSRRQ
ncbi:unnamed protein product (macronuclear) [Paramecium tetraurelia]|uniref:Mitochondrial import inner membrane translocase subunit TIM50 n=1 Tax=Paramecium tetraurelia TaxID=5888 RepID=A0CVN9_PARTE|nr:uncharacterized protein GSPATT00011024001 [Paramecium tetraurelia]CAK74856.1 unnamed protein product [Paramecium tetraurelia]|eukprot:XP_001442253.1 hypothetical protein (macronuclear) [Paramecium tetraurelia strain d4-2]